MTPPKVRTEVWDTDDAGGFQVSVVPDWGRTGDLTDAKFSAIHRSMAGILGRVLGILSGQVVRAEAEDGAPLAGAEAYGIGFDVEDEVFEPAQLSVNLTPARGRMSRTAARDHVRRVVRQVMTS